MKPGDPSLPSAIGRVHGVSPMTARHALALLEREGVVERRPGAGTFVAPPRIHFNKLMSYTEQMGSRGLAPQSKIVLNKIIEDEQEVRRPARTSGSQPHGPKSSASATRRRAFRSGDLLSACQ